MAEMKDSDIRWIGQIPKNWKVIRVKDAFTRKKAKAKQENPVILSLARSGVKVRDITNNEGQLAENYSDYNPVMVDDLLLNPMDLISGDNCNISRVEGVISPAYVNLRYKNGINPEFYNFYFKYQYWCKAFFAYGKGVSFENRWTLNYDTLERFPLILPPIEEQNRIVKFLKGKCAEIDALHTDIEKQIETLEEYKKSIITEAVTKGLDPDVEMKDSGIDYIKTYPSTWTLKRLKYTFTERNERSITGEEELLSVSQYKGVIPSFQNSMRTMQASSLIGYKKVYIDDLVFNKLNPVLARFGRSEYNGITSPDYAVYIINHEYFLTKFLEYILRTDRYSKEYGRVTLGVGDGYTRLYTNQLGCFYVAAPSVDEQEKIILFLKNKVDEIDRVIEDKAKQLETLEQYKKSVIYEYVTGKKEVK